MAKDGSRRSSTVTSARANSPAKNDDDSHAPEPQETGEIIPGAAEAALSRADPDKTSTGSGVDSREVTSQPMPASSTSSNPSAKETASNGSGPAATYGTRSRNRTGASRPNYAEDKELDAEFEVAASVKGPNGRKPKVADPSPPTDHGQGLPKNPSGHEIENHPTVSFNHKDPIPGTSTFSANPTATGTHSKKRKAATQATTQAHPQVPPQSVPRAVTRRTEGTAHVGRGLDDSNMLSFENCGARLVNNKLVADDGTVLEVNGKKLISQWLWVETDLRQTMLTLSASPRVSHTI